MLELLVLLYSFCSFLTHRPCFVPFVCSFLSTYGAAAASVCPGLYLSPSALCKHSKLIYIKAPNTQNPDCLATHSLDASEDQVCVISKADMKSDYGQVLTLFTDALKVASSVCAITQSRAQGLGSVSMTTSQHLESSNPLCFCVKLMPYLRRTVHRWVRVRG